MKYISTRGDKKKKLFSEILLDGLAPDGGLYLPETFPTFTKQELEKMRNFSYAELAFYIFRKFEVDIPDKDLKEICKKTYTENIFKYARNKKGNKKITPVVSLGKNLYLQELSNGPTLAFKDMALQFLGNIFEYFLKKRNRRMNILGATSGDTGSAAEYAMLGKKNINVFMMSPHGKMSPFQQAQMYTLQDKNIFNLCIRGMFDDAQDVVKAVSMDEKFKKKYAIGAVNSINWARILAQVVYYFFGYLQVAKTVDEKIDFSVPTGNFGNICAGWVAKKCGLPIDRLILATNENNVLDEFFKTGVYRPRKSQETYVTSSPSMDISKASNFERFLYIALGNNGELCKKYMEEISKKGSFDLKKTKYWQNVLRENFITFSSTHKNRMETIKSIHKENKIFIDTHTADAVFSSKKFAIKNKKIIVLETAQAKKFEESVWEATGKKVPDISHFESLNNKIQKIYIVNKDVEAVKRFIIDNV